MRTRVLAGVAVLAAGAQVANGQGANTVVFGDASVNTPKARTWGGAAWSGGSATLNVGASPRWIVARSCPIRDELIAVILDHAKDVNAIVRTGSVWGNPNLVEATTTVGTENERPCYIAYERLSGDALLVYRANNTSTIFYRTWNGTAWSATGSTSYPGSGDSRFVKLAPDPLSDEITLVILDSDKDVSAMIWNGSAFTDKVLLTSDAKEKDCELVDATYEQSTGRCLVAWGPNAGTTPAYRVWTGSAWLGAGSLPDVGGKVRWLRLARDPAGNKIIAAMHDDQSDINTVVWDGASWGAVTEVETNCPESDKRRAFDVAFEPAGTRALIVYRENGVHTPRYRTYDGANWSAEASGPDLTKDPAIVQLKPALSGQEIMAAIRRKGDDDLYFLRWTGSAFADGQVLFSDVAGGDDHEAFMLTDGYALPHVTSWVEVNPTP